ncbi:hypothetical protein M2171_000870 [Bradyrhizobium japonicum USDA 38]|nr:hypothetical protein [Bradyrhizobium japonicum USDA 38]MCS3944253.1 hypothetical protein [Bradyrhizobium japonicum]
MTWPDFMTTMARVRRVGGCAGSVKARPSAADSPSLCGGTIEGPAISGSSAGCLSSAGGVTSAISVP